MSTKALPEFQEFLRARKIVPDRKAPFYAHWVSRFLAFSNRNEGVNGDLLVEKFLNQIKKKDNMPGWQVLQAEGGGHRHRGREDTFHRFNNQT